MTNTNPSASYFEQVAGQWDALRSGYFCESVRETAIAFHWFIDFARFLFGY